MASIDELILNQEACVKQLNSATINYKKANAQKKASKHFLVSRLESAKTIFDQIVDLDLRINTFEGEQVVEYNKLDRFTQMDELYHNLKADILDAIDSIETQEIIPPIPNHNPNPNHGVANEANINNHQIQLSTFQRLTENITLGPRSRIPSDN